MDLVLNNLQKLICHKTKPNQTKFSCMCMFGSLFIFNLFLLGLYVTINLPNLRIEREINNGLFMLNLKFVHVFHRTSSTHMGACTHVTVTQEKQ